MKKITVNYCDECPYLVAEKDKKYEFETYKCSYPEIVIQDGRKSYIYHGDKLIGNSNELDPDIPIIIPGWCDLEDD